MAVIEIKDDNFKKETEESKIPVIIDFFAAWCGPCQMLGPVFESLSKEYTGKLKFCKVNTENYSDLALKYSITGIPCLIVLNKGKEADRIMGFLPKEVLKEKIDLILKGI